MSESFWSGVAMSLDITGNYGLNLIENDLRERERRIMALKKNITVSYRDEYSEEAKKMSDAGKLASARAIRQARVHGVMISYLKNGVVVIERVEDIQKDERDSMVMSPDPDFESDRTETQKIQTLDVF